MPKTVPITPTRPQARQDAPLPELRSRLESILNVPMGESRSWPAQGGVKYRYASGLFSPRASLDDRFEHPVQVTSHPNESFHDREINFKRCPDIPPILNERGMALLFALLVLALLVTLIVGFDAQARREIKEAAAFRDGFKAVALARVGVQAARATLLHDALLDAQSGRPYDALTDLWAMPVKGRAIGDGMVSASIIDERGKLNLNDLASSGSSSSRAAMILRFKRLFIMIQVDPQLVDAITDWVDADNLPLAAGAETDYYESLQPPYRAANAPLQTLDELHLVRGVTDAVLQRLAPYVTVYPTIPDGLINLNTADPMVIQALDPRVTPAMALEVMQGRPYRTLQDVDRVASIEGIVRELRLTGGYTVRSDHFSVAVSVTINEVTKNANAVVRRASANGETSELYFRIE